MKSKLKETPNVYGGFAGGIQRKSNGNGRNVKSYTTWSAMLQRCNSLKFQSTNKTYAGCSVCKEWFFYSNFKRWHDLNYKEGFHLDKDLLVSGNKIYGPSFCRYIPQSLNNLTVNRKALRGNCPQGVTLNPAGKYVVMIRKCSKQCYLGSFETPEEAGSVYKLEKESHVRSEALRYYKDGSIDIDMYNSLSAFELK